MTRADQSHCVELKADCRVRAATDLFTHRWDPVVLVALGEGAQRRRDLRWAIGGLSDKVLTESLRRLVRQGLVGRRSLPAAPPHVEYRLTALGESLVRGPLRALARWIDEHGDELLAAEEHADRVDLP
ncbi:transcriptional regulator [Actinoalloteichus sp. AHMU CJ021]|uniref:Transcriptional regulator n=2 Tax=Actinoalloteichus cyanogriseus TaxID=2893586 RepID=M1F4X0_ACTCY|nr:helix-turn-helix domain-containing protein [Actinoalloteichus caeruleus]AFK24526.1 transcriptional regulator [Actinoalloteichus caeruleus]AUS77168.1 transcriptional regulator [Actinoalloteichus sp. AHMU CJ021]MCP2330983.1 transcriptional regulator, HxlR family [Actinoalloteichus caeruleus DSM 43889]